MKSLYIVNRKIEEIENYEDDNKQISMTITYNQLKQIQQSLEVLEIIKKKDVLTRVLKFCLKESENDQKALDSYNLLFPDNRDLTMEELLKIKQWLEENDE